MTTSRRVELRLDFNGESAANQLGKVGDAAAKAAQQVGQLQSQMQSSSQSPMPGSGTPNSIHQPPPAFQSPSPFAPRSPWVSPVPTTGTGASTQPLPGNPNSGTSVTGMAGSSSNPMLKYLEESAMHLRRILDTLQRGQPTAGRSNTPDVAAIEQHVRTLEQRIESERRASAPSAYGLLPQDGMSQGDANVRDLNRRVGPITYGLQSQDAKSIGEAIATEFKSRLPIPVHTPVTRLAPPTPVWSSSSEESEATERGLQRLQGRDSLGTDANISMQDIRGITRQAWQRHAGEAWGAGASALSRVGNLAMRGAGYATAALEVGAAVGRPVHELGLMESQGGGTTGQSLRKIAQSNALSRYLLGNIDDIRGRSQDFQIEDEEQQRRVVRNQGMMESRTTRNEIMRERGLNQNRADVLAADQRLVGMPTADRSTVMGRRAYEEAMIQRPTQMQGLQRERELAISERNLKSEEQNRDRLNSEMIRFRQMAANAEGRMGNTDGVDAQKAVNQFKNAQDNVEKLNAELRQAEQRIEAARGKVIESRAENSRTALDMLQNKAEILARREQTAAGQAQRIGGMSEMDFAYSQEALGRVRQNKQFAHPDDIAAASQLAPEEVTEIREGIGKQRIKQLGESRPKELLNLDQLRQDQAQVGNEMEKLAKKLQDDQAKQVAKELNSDKLIAAFDERTKRTVEAAIEALTVKIREGNLR
jgi:hypothetical protein